MNDDALRRQALHRMRTFDATFAGRLQTVWDLLNRADQGNPGHHDELPVSFGHLFDPVEDDHGWIPPWALRFGAVWDSAFRVGWNGDGVGHFHEALRWLAAQPDPEGLARAFQAATQLVGREDETRKALAVALVAAGFEGMNLPALVAQLQGAP